MENVKEKIDGIEREFEKQVGIMALTAGGYAMALYEELAGGFSEHFRLAIVPTPEGTLGYTCIPVTAHSLQLMTMLRQVKRTGGV